MFDLQPTSTMRQGIHLAPRYMDWDFSDAPACLVEGSPEMSAFMLTLSYFVVAFEDFGIPVVRADLDNLKDDPALHREAQTFLSQEALHSQGHVLFNDTMNRRHGIDTTEVNAACDRFLAEMRAGSQADQLAAVAALEHVIYNVCTWYFGETELQARSFPEFNRLLLWHAMEETEHTAVVYDMYRHIYGNGPAAYATRIKALGRSTRAGIRVLYAIWRALLPQLAAKAGTIENGTPWSPLLKESARHLKDYFRFVTPGFSPWTEPPSQQLLAELRAHMVPAHPDSDSLPVIVAAIRDVAADVRAYDLVAVDGGDLPAWDAGAHVDVEIETGIVRQYSLCGDPADRGCYTIAVKREALGRGGSLRLHQEIRLGDRVRIGAPRNNFTLDPADDHVTLLAGGIGITPLLAMARTLHAKGTPFTLHLCARDGTLLPFGAEFDGWPFADQVRVHLDSAEPAGRVNVATLVPEHAPGHAIYSCGPAPFMDAVVAAAKSAGWPEKDVRLERFARPKGPQVTDKPFTVMLAKSDRSIPVAADQTIVEALEANGLKPKTSCREGVCGACVCRVVAGAADHRDVVLSDTEHRNERKIAICVSRAKGDHLTLDL